MPKGGGSGHRQSMYRKLELLGNELTMWHGEGERVRNRLEGLRPEDPEYVKATRWYNHCVSRVDELALEIDKLKYPLNYI
jgi:hypothetical protein